MLVKAEDILKVYVVLRTVDSSSAFARLFVRLVTDNSLREVVLTENNKFIVSDYPATKTGNPHIRNTIVKVIDNVSAGTLNNIHKQFVKVVHDTVNAWDYEQTLNAIKTITGTIETKNGFTISEDLIAELEA